MDFPMCGRYTLSKKEHLEQMVEEAGFLFDEFSELRIVPRFNVAPSQQIPVILDEAPRTITSAKWGLIPSWANDAKIGNSLLHARAETVSEKPAFRTAFRKRRCWVPADGFYEWQKTPTGRQPYRFTLKNESLFFFAGLWEVWRDAEGKEIRTVSLITTQPNSVTQPVHDRMPVILTRENRDKWMAKDAPVEELRDLLIPYPADEMKAMPVSVAVNNAKYDGPELIAPLLNAGVFQLEA